MSSRSSKLAFVTTALSGDARAQILMAARAELEEHGHAAIGLRAVARRAGVSHAAPGYFFGDRAGMLTALAVEGFGALAERLERVEAAPSESRLAALGHEYVEFGLGNAALFELMFSASELRSEDPELEAARHRAISALSRAVDGPASPVPSPRTVMAWALAHGLVTLANRHALTLAGQGSTAVIEEVLHSFTALS
jgi:AcrR family transcriptional regulator